jgi:hypothetical protein
MQWLPFLMSWRFWDGTFDSNTMYVARDSVPLSLLLSVTYTTPVLLLLLLCLFQYTLERVIVHKGFWVFLYIS